ncbi:P-loop containing nucleoside triphosphate hydrolase protein [Ganoderma leucocontextum]|nr:P-loop containing nucleoside triphosphate hydrolase protein [Ganoderma leucocontextum]
MSSELPDVSEIRARTVEKLGRKPCLWQCDVARALLKGEDVVCISGTGSGKTLTFWIPLLFRLDGVQVIITLLNLLGIQNQEELARWKISAIAISGETASLENFKAARSLQHGVVEWIWKNTAFTSRIISVVWDEAHCIKLRSVLSPNTPYLIPSATLPPVDRADVLEALQARIGNLLLIRRSNDRPNVYLTVRKLQYSMASFQDLDFLIPKDWAPDSPGVQLPRFLVFFDNIEDSLKAAERLRNLLTKAHCDRVVWFNSDNTPEFREDATSEFREHKLFGLYCTDSFGMGVDISDIEIIVQWRVMCSMNAMWQRFGCAARGIGREAIAILLAEPKYFDDEKALAAAHAEKKEVAAKRRAEKREAVKRKRADSGAVSVKPAAKRGKQSVGALGAEEPRSVQDSGAAMIEDIDGPQEMVTVTDSGDAEMSSRSHGGDEGRDERVRVAVTGPPATAQRSLLETSKDDLTVYEQLHVEYHQVQRLVVGKGQGGKKRLKGPDAEATLAPELDSFVNAGFRLSVRCYRKPITVFYENDKIDADSRACTPGSEGPCPRCVPMPSPICCSLCSPSHKLFDILPPLEADDSGAKAPSKQASKVTSTPMTSTDTRLQAALHAFRRDQTIKLFGCRHLNSNGPGAIMGNEILERIIECARVRKLADLDALYRETKWNRAQELGTDVLKIIHE